MVFLQRGRPRARPGEPPHYPHCHSRRNHSHLRSALATPVVVNATTAEGLVVTASVIATASAAEPACERTIKVVYAGYGEAKAVPCTVLAH